MEWRTEQGLARCTFTLLIEHHPSLIKYCQGDFWVSIHAFYTSGMRLGNLAFSNVPRSDLIDSDWSILALTHKLAIYMIAIWLRRERPLKFRIAAHQDCVLPILCERKQLPSPTFSCSAVSVLTSRYGICYLLYQTMNEDRFAVRNIHLYSLSIPMQSLFFSIALRLKVCQQSKKSFAFLPLILDHFYSPRILSSILRPGLAPVCLFTLASLVRRYAGFRAVASLKFVYPDLYQATLRDFQICRLYISSFVTFSTFWYLPYEQKQTMPNVDQLVAM